jgi:tRNA 2-thiouridine synthesizing protein B
MDSCLKRAGQGSSVLLYEDGVYGAMQGTSVAELVASAQGVKVYALGPDMKARGLSADRLIDGVEVVDYAGFVNLAVEHDKVIAWT